MGNLVLIADDDMDIVRFVALNLRLEGFDVVASDGQDALDKALDVRPSLIPLDTMMPCMNGYEVCSRFRDQRPDAAIPVIMLTAKSLDADRAMAFTGLLPTTGSASSTRPTWSPRSRPISAPRAWRWASGACRGNAWLELVELAPVLRLARLHLGPLHELLALGLCTNFMIRLVSDAIASILCTGVPMVEPGASSAHKGLGRLRRLPVWSIR